MSVYEVVAIEKKVEQGAIGLMFNSKLSVKIYGSNLNTSPRASPIGYVHVAFMPPILISKCHFPTSAISPLA